MNGECLISSKEDGRRIEILNKADNKLLYSLIAGDPEQNSEFVLIQDKKVLASLKIDDNYIPDIKNINPTNYVKPPSSKMKSKIIIMDDKDTEPFPKPKIEQIQIEDRPEPLLSIDDIDDTYLMRSVIMNALQASHNFEDQNEKLSMIKTIVSFILKATKNDPKYSTPRERLLASQKTRNFQQIYDSLAAILEYLQ